MKILAMTVSFILLESFVYAEKRKDEMKPEEQKIRISKQESIDHIQKNHSLLQLEMIKKITQNYTNSNFHSRSNKSLQADSSVN